MNKLYFVSARLNGWTVFAGHWLAPTPAKAIELGKAAADESAKLPEFTLSGSDRTNWEWQARTSRASVFNAINRRAFTC